MHLTFTLHQNYHNSIQTKNIIPKVYHPKIFENLAVGMDNNEINPTSRWKKERNKKFRIMYAGRIYI